MSQYPVEINGAIVRLIEHFRGNPLPADRFAKDLWLLVGFAARLALGDPDPSIDNDGGGWMANAVAPDPENPGLVTQLSELHQAICEHHNLAAATYDSALGDGQLIRWLITQILENLLGGDGGGELIQLIIRILLEQIGN